MEDEDDVLEAMAHTHTHERARRPSTKWRRFLCSHIIFVKMSHFSVVAAQLFLGVFPRNLDLFTSRNLDYLPCLWPTGQDCSCRAGQIGRGALTGGQIPNREFGRTWPGVLLQSCTNCVQLDPCLEPWSSEGRKEEPWTVATEISGLQFVTWTGREAEEGRCFGFA